MSLPRTVLNRHGTDPPGHVHCSHQQVPGQGSCVLGSQVSKTCLILYNPARVSSLNSRKLSSDHIAHLRNIKQLYRDVGSKSLSSFLEKGRGPSLKKIETSSPKDALCQISLV